MEIGDKFKKELSVHGEGMETKLLALNTDDNSPADVQGQGFIFKKTVSNQDIPVLSFAPEKKIEMGREALNPIVEIDYSYDHHSSLLKPDKWGRIKLFDRGNYIELQATVVTHLTENSKDTSFIVTLRLPSYVLTELRKSAA